MRRHRTDDGRGAGGGVSGPSRGKGRPGDQPHLLRGAQRCGRTGENLPQPRGQAAGGRRPRGPSAPGAAPGAQLLVGAQPLSGGGRRGGLRPQDPARPGADRSGFRQWGGHPGAAPGGGAHRHQLPLLCDDGRPGQAAALAPPGGPGLPPAGGRLVRRPAGELPQPAPVRGGPGPLPAGAPGGGRPEAGRAAGGDGHLCGDGGQLPPGVHSDRRRRGAGYPAVQAGAEFPGVKGPSALSPRPGGPASAPLCSDPTAGPVCPGGAGTAGPGGGKGGRPGHRPLSPRGAGGRPGRSAGRKNPRLFVQTVL